MLSTRTWHLKDRDEHEKQTNIFYQKEGSKLRKRYVLEYCDDPKKFERLGNIGVEVDDVYHQVVFEETEDKEERFWGFDGIALELYLYYLFYEPILDVKLWEEIYEGDELISERYIAMPSTFHHQFGKLVNKDVMENRDALRKENEELKKTLATYANFIKKYNAEQTYQEYIREVVA